MPLPLREASTIALRWIFQLVDEEWSRRENPFWGFEEIFSMLIEWIILEINVEFFFKRILKSEWSEEKSKKILIF